jgi:hypothetical protein
MKRNTNTPLQGATLRRRIKSIGKKNIKRKKREKKIKIHIPKTTIAKDIN